MYNRIESGQLNLESELKHINTILDQNKARKLKSFNYDYFTPYNIDLIFYRRLIRSFKQTKLQNITWKLDNQEKTLTLKNGHAEYTLYLT